MRQVDDHLAGQCLRRGERFGHGAHAARGHAGLAQGFEQRVRAVGTGALAERGLELAPVLEARRVGREAPVARQVGAPSAAQSLPNSASLPAPIVIHASLQGNVP
jgi:hypothetical protein